MYILMDIEWVQNENQRRHPTQIAAMRVDEHWRFQNMYYTRIQPPDESFHQWEHMAYAGGSAEDFLSAPVITEVSKLIKAWYRNDDILCWWTTDTMEFFESMFGLFPQRQLVLFPYLRRFLSDRPHLAGSPYHIADQLSIERYGSKHDSRSDTEMMRRALREIGFPQRLLTEPAALMTGNEKTLVPYVLDIAVNRIHKRGCGRIPTSMECKGYPTLKNIVNNGCKPCACCVKDFAAARRERNRWIIENSEYNFVFSPNSNVFHTRECKMVLSSALDVRGTMKYKTCIERKRKPCKICNPACPDTEKTSPSPVFRKQCKQPPQRKLVEQEKRALERLKQAQEERKKTSRLLGMSLQKLEDIQTLTHPGYAFWAVTGYKRFHLRHCSRLNSISNVKGFGLYEDAVRAGYHPCRQCKPSPKHNLELSFPLYSKERPDEKRDVLAELCKTAGYAYTEMVDCSQIETQKGIWRIYTESIPYRMEHINKRYSPGNTTEFHIQPRIFLSLTDAFMYIKRHDNEE